MILNAEAKVKRLDILLRVIHEMCISYFILYTTPCSNVRVARRGVAGRAGLIVRES
jgi:hypothetical protein